MAQTDNKHLNESRDKERFDEFYTQKADIEREVLYYKDQFEGKVVYCNCDDPKVSDFVTYFKEAFLELKLSKLIATYYTQGASESLAYIYTSEGEVEVSILGDGSYDSEACLKLLDEADIVVTNPPFTEFKNFLTLLIERQKQFLILGSMNALSYKSIQPFITQGLVSSGNHYGAISFRIPDDAPEKTNQWVDEQGQRYQRFGNIMWYTNMNHAKRFELFETEKVYHAEDFTAYDNYDAIEVSKVKDIPKDYFGVMGVPISFIHKHNPHQFEILGFDSDIKDGHLTYLQKEGDFKYDRGYINGKRKYPRVFIKRLTDTQHEAEKPLAVETFVDKNTLEQKEPTCDKPLAQEVLKAEDQVLVQDDTLVEEEHVLMQENTSVKEQPNEHKEDTLAQEQSTEHKENTSVENAIVSLENQPSQKPVRLMLLSLLSNVFFGVNLYLMTFSSLSLDVDFDLERSGLFLFLVSLFISIFTIYGVSQKKKIPLLSIFVKLSFIVSLVLFFFIYFS